MLVLSRKLNQNIVIDGKIIIKVVRLEGDVVKIGIQAPQSISVHRQEVYDEIERTNRTALRTGQRVAPRLKDQDKNPDPKERTNR